MPDQSPEDLAEASEIERIVRECSHRISEHTDSCIIFVTKHMESGSKTTWGFHRVAGNHFAAYGQVREWLVQEEGMQARRYNAPDEGEEA